jgi:hypothetical protein
VMTRAIIEMTCLLREIPTAIIIIPTAPPLSGLVETRTTAFESFGGRVEARRRPVMMSRRVVMMSRRVVMMSRRPVMMSRRLVMPRRRVVMMSRRPVMPRRRPVMMRRRLVMPRRRPVMMRRRLVMPRRRPVMMRRRLVMPWRRPVMMRRRLVMPRRRPVMMRRRLVMPRRRAEPRAPSRSPAFPPVAVSRRCLPDHEASAAGPWHGGRYGHGHSHGQGHAGIVTAVPPDHSCPDESMYVSPDWEQRSNTPSTASPPRDTALTLPQL